MGKYSYSKLDTYKSCPFKFKLQYVDGNYVYVGSIATVFGSLIHITEESIAKALQAGEKIDYVQLKNKFILELTKIQHDYKDEFFKLDTKSSRTYNDKAYEYLEKEIHNLENFMKKHPTYEIMGIEQKFNFKFDEDHIFTGAIDRVFHDKATDQYFIQDIKSWAVEADSKDLATPLQFVVYTLAAKELWHCSEEQVHCSYYLPLVRGGLEQHAGTKGYMARGLKKLNELFEHIKSEDYAPNPTPLCNYCNFCRTNPDAPVESKYLCPYYCLWERTTRNRADLSKSENEWQGMQMHPLILEAYHKKYNLVQNNKLN